MGDFLLLTFTLGNSHRLKLHLIQIKLIRKYADSRSFSGCMFAEPKEKEKSPDMLGQCYH